MQNTTDSPRLSLVGSFWYVGCRFIGSPLSLSDVAVYGMVMSVDLAKGD